MSRKISMFLAGLSIGLAVLMSGCNPTADLNLKFSPEQTSTYKAVSEVVKDFRFEQPNLGKLREEQTKTVIEMTFTQTIDSLDEAGNATATITIKDLKIEMINKNEQKFAFDSTDKKDAKSPMSKLLGQSYRIQISPTGNVKVLDAQAAKTSVRAGYEKKIVTSILDDKNIIACHEVIALPQEKSSGLAVNDSWTQTVSSPPGLLAPKNYQKTYTLTDLDTQAGVTVATIEMVAGEDAKAASSNSLGGGMGIFAKMFDNEDTYKGSMEIDLDSGVLLTMEETLISTYLAQEMPENGDPAKGPDTLTMQFTNRVLLEKLN